MRKYIMFFNSYDGVDNNGNKKSFIAGVKYRINDITPTDYIIAGVSVPRKDEDTLYKIGKIEKEI